MIQVVAALIEQDGKVLIAQRGKGQKMADLWEFPGGKVETGEGPEAALKRELLEELNLEIEVLELYGEHKHHYPQFSIQLSLYRVQWRGGKLKLKEHQQVQWVPKAQLINFPFTAADLPFVEKITGS